MSARFYEIMALVMVAIVYLAPFSAFGIKYKLWKDFNFLNFTRVLNRSAFIYLYFFIIFVAYTVGNSPLIEDTEYPDSDEILIGGVVVGFLFSFVFFLLPIIIIINGIRYMQPREKSAKPNN